MTPEATKPEAQEAPEAPKVIGLHGTPVAQPHGRWLAEVDQDGNLVRQDGMLVKVRD